MFSSFLISPLLYSASTLLLISPLFILLLILFSSFFSLHSPPHFSFSSPLQAQKFATSCLFLSLHSNFSKTKFIHPSICFLYLLISIRVTGQMKMCFMKLQKQYHACCCPSVTQMQPAPVLLPLIKTTKDSRVTWGCGE